MYISTVQQCWTKFFTMCLQIFQTLFFTIYVSAIFHTLPQGRLGNCLAISQGRSGAYLALSHGVAVTGSCPLGLQKPSILQSPLSIWLDAQLLSWLLLADCALSHLRSHGLSLSLCHWLVFWGLQAQFHQPPLTYLHSYAQTPTKMKIN